MMHKYIVYSPPFVTYHGGWNLPEDAQVPEEGVDVWEGEAKNAREAKILAVREWSKDYKSWINDQRSEGHNPFSGLKAERLDTVDCNCGAHYYSEKHLECPFCGLSLEDLVYEYDFSHDENNF